MRRRWLALAVMLTAASGCDNVDWGGIDVDLAPPPDRADLVPASAARSGDGPMELPALPRGPLLLAGTRTGTTATLAVVGAVGPDGLTPLVSERLAPGYQDLVREALLSPGSEFILFSNGVRVGRMTATRNGSDETFCESRPTVSGVIEVIPDAANIERFLALPAEAGGSRAYETFTGWEPDPGQQRAAIALGTQAIPTVGARWPNSMSGAREDMQAFRMADASGPSVAATYMYLDDLGVGEPSREGSYSLFVMGTSNGQGNYDRSFLWYRPADAEGKGAPRYFDHLDWDRDGRSEVLLQIFGTDSEWFAALDQDGGEWVRSFQDGCGARAPTP